MTKTWPMHITRPNYLKRKSSGELVSFYGHTFAKDGKIKNTFQVIYHLHDGRYVVEDIETRKQTAMTEADLHGPQIRLYKTWGLAQRATWGPSRRRVNKNEPPPWEGREK
jgi:hypothetical protein